MQIAACIGFCGAQGLAISPWLAAEPRAGLFVIIYFWGCGGALHQRSAVAGDAIPAWLGRNSLASQQHNNMLSLLRDHRAFTPAAARPR
jgi:hypothetical protein